MNAGLLRSLITAVGESIIAHAGELTALDQAIGDGDHGLNMKRGFTAILAEADALAEKPFPEALKAIGTLLVLKVGGASGPLYGTLCIELGKAVRDVPDRAGLADALGSAIEAVQARGKSQPGQKTMLDVWVPVQHALAAGEPDIAALADEVADATAPMRAIRGRASFLGERSVGHIDPGARSSALIIRAIWTVLGEG